MHQGQKIYSLQAITSDPLATRNTILFAALTAMGVPPEPNLCGEYVEIVGGKMVDGQLAGGERRSITVWRFRDRTMDGLYRTSDLLQLWHDPEFVAREPEHPLAYIKAAFDNHSRAMEFIREVGPIAMRRRGKKVGLVTKRTSPELKKRILDELNK